MLYSIIHIIWIIIQACVAITLIFPVISYFIYLISNKRLKTFDKKIAVNDYAIIVTAYKHTGNLVHVVDSLLKINHPNYTIYLVADDCPEFEDTFHNEKVVVLKPVIPFANQVKSHFFAIENFVRPHTLLTIIDSDNLVEPNYLHALDKYFDAGYEAVQGIRKAKNLDTQYACIDAVNEIYYLFYDRKILFGIGSSCMLSGSGMAFTVSLFKECMGTLNSSGAGFDKILQKQILQRGCRIAFAKEAIVYDEKTANKEQLVKQRARWNNTWFRYFKYGFFLMAEGVKNFSINRFLFGFLLTRPPLFILIIISFFIFVINLFINFYAAGIWVILFLIFIGGFFLALKKSDTDKRIYQALVHIPKFMWMQILSLLKAKKANEFSVATEHAYNKEIEKIEK